MKSILVIDDNKDFNLMISTFLIDEGHYVESCYNGEEGLRRLEGDNKSFDLIILDLMMPKMNGYEFIKELSNTSIDTPIFILSANIDDKLITCKEREGVVGYFSKLDDLGFIMTKVNQFFRDRKDISNVVSIFTAKEIDYNFEIIDESETNLVISSDKDIESNSILKIKNKQGEKLYFVEHTKLENMKTIVCARKITSR